MAASPEQIQAGLENTFRQVHAPSQELSSVNSKVEFLNNGHVNRDKIFGKSRQASCQVVNMISSSCGGSSGMRSVTSSSST